MGIEATHRNGSHDLPIKASVSSFSFEYCRLREGQAAFYSYRRSMFPAIEVYGVEQVGLLTDGQETADLEYDRRFLVRA